MILSRLLAVTVSHLTCLGLAHRPSLQSVGWWHATSPGGRGRPVSSSMADPRLSLHPSSRMTGQRRPCWNGNGMQSSVGGVAAMAVSQASVSPRFARGTLNRRLGVGTPSRLALVGRPCSGHAHVRGFVPESDAASAHVLFAYIMSSEVASSWTLQERERLPYMSLLWPPVE